MALVWYFILLVMLSKTDYSLYAAPIENIHLPSIGRFWHVSDLHLDPTYHIAKDPTKVCYSSKGVPASDPGLFGDFMCDSPYALIQSAFSHMTQVSPRPDFMIWTGDSPPHVPAGELSTDIVIQVIGNMTETIREHFPTMPVYPALGNHDYWPQDQFPTSTNAIYQAVAKLWEPWLQPQSLLTLREGGFYCQLVRPGLRVLSLNTVLYYSPNDVTVNETDPAGQFQWLQDTLDMAGQNREKVFVIGHVPLGYLPYARGTTAIREAHNERLVAIFRKYSHVVAGHFYGHTHRDSVMVLLDHTGVLVPESDESVTRKGKPVTSMFVAPAVTPIKSLYEPYSNNPAFRMYHYDSGDKGLLDIWQYYLNLTKANQEVEADWSLEYVMTESFGLRDLRPQSLLQLGLSLQLPQSRAFDRYFHHFMVSYDVGVTCEGSCRTAQVCAVLGLDRRSYYRCLGGPA